MERNNGDGAWLNTEECLQYGFITEEITAVAADSDYLKSKIQNMFNLKNRPMKKSIMTFAAIVALLAVQEMDANKEGCVLMDDESLKKINDALEAKQSEIDKLKKEKEEAETAKAEAEKAKNEADEAKNEAETAKADAESKLTAANEKVEEYKAFIAKIPNADTKVHGKDTEEKDDFQKAYENSEMYQNALSKM